jgi:uncharacterized protein (DUF1810 family)
MTDPFDLERFVNAQSPVYPRVLDELRHDWPTGASVDLDEASRRLSAGLDIA